MMKTLRLLIIGFFCATSVQLSAQNNVVPDQDEFNALKDLWTNLAGSSWTVKTNWPTAGNWPASATATQMDAWFGIVVTNGDITEISLPQNNLDGTLPSSLSNLTKLVTLSLQNNKLRNAIPTSLTTLTNLVGLRLDLNLLTGTIPDFSSITTLKTLYLSSNSFTAGPIPSWINNLTNLENLGLASTSRNSSFPDLSGLTHLVNAQFGSNSLTGGFPTSLTEVTTLKFLELGSNQLTGRIPPEIGNLTALEKLGLQINKFYGDLPDELNNLTHLQYLNFYTNRFTGIPADLSSLTSLIVLSGSDNLMQGYLPELAHNLTTITEIRLNSNQLYGSIPTSYGGLTNVTYLILNDNKLTGSIPSQIGSMTKLIQLLLHNNQLTGVLPTQLSSLVNLTGLYLYNNKLSGEIPSSFSALTKIQNFYIYNNQFSGVLPNIFTTMTMLAGVNIENNRFKGTLPSLRGTNINVASNSFTGAFPSITGAPTSVNAANNGFTSIPSTVSGWGSLQSLNFANNELTSLPTLLETHSNKANILLNVSNNRLDYTMLKPYTTGFKSPTTLMPQKTVADQLTKTIVIGSQFTLSSRAISGSDSIFWEKQSKAGTWISLSNDEDNVMHTYTKTATKDDEGIYRWKMTAWTTTSFRGTAIYSEPVQVKTAMQFTLDNWSFQYRYDGRKRMTHKKVPGADWVYMVYDDRDRLVMTQDGEQRKSKKWTYTRYDGLNRPIITGLYTHNDADEQAEMSSNISGTVFFETLDGGPSLFGYTDLVSSASSLPGKFEPLTVTYYDNYDFLRGDPYFAYKSNQLPDQDALANYSVNGQVTGTWTRILGSNRQWLRSVVYYDDKYRVIQSITDNHKRGQDVTTNVYDFPGKVLNMKTSSIDHRINWTTPLHVYAKIQDERLVSVANNTSYGFSAQDITASGWVEFTLSKDTTITLTSTFGLSAGTGTTGSVTYSVRQSRTSSSNSIRVYEGTKAKGTSIAVSAGDVIRIGRKDTLIYYMRNGHIFRDTVIATKPTLKAHAVLTGLGADVYNPRISVNGPTQSTARIFEYDHVGRLVNTYHSVDDVQPILLSSQTYNEIGQLIDKKIHSTDSTNFKQSIDYRYNIRGWLTSMNGADLGNTDPNANKDLFGMDLLYNDDTESGIGNTPMYNGNISAMKWSNNFGLGTVKRRAYKFDYDAMNRLNAASQKVYNTAWASSTAFHESGITYDLNGNIKTLLRTDLNGGQMDSLTYKYGTGDVASNRLLRVNDVWNTNGFTNGTNADNDYVYDNNGNLIVDKNKSIQSISYNHLNLPVKVTKTSGDYILYTYDATGRKLIQDVYDPSNVLKKRSDYHGEWFLENDTLKFINHEEGRAVVEGEWSQAPQLVPNSTLSTTTGYTSISTTGLTNETIAGSAYMKVTSNQTGGNPGFTSGEIDVKPGSQYMLRFKGYRVGTGSIFVSVYSIQQSTLLSNSTGPAVGLENDRWFEAVFTVPTYANKVKFQMQWFSDVQSGHAMYLDEIQLYEYHPGHGTHVFTQSGYTYQYHLKDHLGNVRMTFTTKDESESLTANMEADGDNSQFLNYDKARFVVSSIFDRTNGTSPGRAQRLSGSATEKVGLAKSFAVMPGDRIRAEVYAKYFDADAPNLDVALQGLLTSLLNPAGSGGQIVDGSGYSVVAATNMPWAWGNGHQSDSSVPKAYLNYIYINRDFDVNSLIVDYRAISSAALEDGSNGDHELLSLDTLISEPGYVYVYLSNDGEEVKEVYFDDFKVEHVKSPVISSQSYYPFGLTFDNYSRENSLSNQYQYNGKEQQDELSLGWLDYGARMYMSDIGRWGVVDPLSEATRRLSPFNYALNNPIRFIDPDGMKAEDVYVSESGEYLGKDGAATNDVRVVNKDKFNEVQTNNGGTTSEGATQQLQGSSTKLTEYGEGIKMSEDTWDQVEKAGGERQTPFVENGSEATIYYKPEGAPHDSNGNTTGPNPNPGKENDGAYPISPGTDLYTPVDGIKTTATPNGQVFKVPTGATIQVDKKGNPDMDFNGAGDLMRLHPSYGNVKPPDASFNKLANSKPK